MIIVDIPLLGKREYDENSPNFLVDFISDQMEYLIKLYRAGHHKDKNHILYDIGFYKYMLGKENATDLIKEYRKVVDELNTTSKKAAAEKLGWDVKPWKG